MVLSLNKSEALLKLDKGDTMQKMDEEYGVGHVASGERKGKEVTMESGNLPEKMMAQRRMMNKNEIK